VKKRYRLRRHVDFQAAISGKRFYSGRAVVAFAIPSDASESRIGVTVSRAVKRAVDRNRARRRLRDLARRHMLAPDSPMGQVGIRYDVVLVARPAALEVSSAALRAEVDQASQRLSRLDR
jgi:ribonuclease P protein component